MDKIKYVRLFWVLLSMLDSTTSQLVFNDTEGKIEEQVGIFDDSLEHILQLEPLRLRISPTPVRLDFNQSSIILNDVEDIVSHYFRMMNREGHHLGKFRAMEFGDMGDIRFDAANDSGSGASATVIDIQGVQVSFVDEMSDEKILMQNLQQFINGYNFSSHNSMVLSQTRAQKGSNMIGHSSEVFFQMQYPIQSITLTWASQGYTMAPSPSPDSSVTSPDVSVTRRPFTKIHYPLLAGGFVAMILSLLLIKKYKVWRAIAHGSVAASRRHLRIHRNEFDGLDFLHPSIAVGSEHGGFPIFDRCQSPTIKVQFVDLDSQPMSPQDIGEIIATDSGSEVSSLGQSENRVVVTCPVHNLGALRAFPITNLTSVGGSNGRRVLYHETQEGFERLDRDEWESNEDLAMQSESKLLKANSDSLRYSSDVSSLDMAQFMVDDAGTNDGEVDMNPSSNPEQCVPYTNPKSWLDKSISVFRYGRFMRSRTVEVDGHPEDDGHSSVGEILRSVV